ncbi:PREDICTED: uncharacterized protein LOC108562358 isoform X1 [Nicrophorus vespilloides]|uniref:Uncharacterized protein LOC108562358 isoform X1 n=1 Tax=Nicrophorus vespilloides TaxID=110193 RepID=A0ABM1MNJ4_NICVS|nr:PREDICTED: uncharacterized protein LOC108562358 isoform X1 [Nicrophorus vespilloides]
MVSLYPFWIPSLYSYSYISGIKFISFYTIVMSIIFMNFTMYYITRINSRRHYNPLYEVISRPTLNRIMDRILIFIFLLIVSSCYLIMGVNLKIRSLMIPWMVFFGFVVSFQLIILLWQLEFYFMGFHNLTGTLINFIWITKNIHCWIVVYSKFKFIGLIPTPNIEIFS